MSTNQQAGGNALAQRPTLEQEMAKFKGFVTNNGETVDGEATKKGPGERNVSPEEEAAGMTAADGNGEKKETKPDAGKVELTDAEKTAALDKARTVLKLEDDEELSPEEEAAALAEALKDKKAASGKKPANGKNQTEAERRAHGRARAAEARARAAEANMRSLEERLAALEGKGGTLTPQGTPAKGDDDKEPDPTKYELGELDPKYIRALARWETRQEIAEAARKNQTDAQTAEQQRAQREVEEQVAAFEEAGAALYDDFQEVVLDTLKLPKTDPAYWPLSATLAPHVRASEQGPQIAYALASDPKEAWRVAKMPAAQQLRWFFRQEAKFEAEKSSADASGENEGESSGRETPSKQPAQRTATNAPPPPRRRINGAGSTQRVSADTQDFAAFEALARGAATPRR